MVIYSFQIPGEVHEYFRNLCEPYIKIGLIENPKGKILQALNLINQNNRNILFSGLPQTILKNSSSPPKVALSIGATHPKFIAYQDIFSQPLLNEVKKDFSFPAGVYGLINLLTLYPPNKNELELLQRISQEAYLSEYRHKNLIQLPFFHGFYQPQYGWSAKSGFFGSDKFEHFFDQTLNLVGQGFGKNDKEFGIIISGPWCFNQPNNPWAINLTLDLLSRINITPNCLISCDTGGQTGFWYLENGQYQFSHKGEHANMQHTTLALFGFS